MLPFLLAAGAPVLGGLASSLINKIIGDAPPSAENLGLVDSAIGDKMSLMRTLDIQPSLATPDLMQGLQRSTPEAWSTAYQQARNHLSTLATLPPEAVQRAQASNSISNHLGQAISDGAAMKQIVPLPHLEGGKPGQVASANQQFLPQTQIPSLQMLSNQLRANPNYSNNLWTSSNIQPNLQNSWQANQGQIPVLDSSQTATALLQTPQLQQFPSTLNQPWQTTPIVLAPQPLDKTKANQATLTFDPTATREVIGNGFQPSFKPPYGLNPGAMTKPAFRPPGLNQTLADNTNSFLGTVTGAGTQALANIGNSLVNKGTSALGNFVSNLANKGSNLLSSAISGLFSKIVGDAPPNIRPGLTAEYDTARKVIGDAPPSLGLTQAYKIIGDAPPGDVMDDMGETMTPEQSDAAISNISNSASFALMSQLVLEEQVLQLAKGLSSGLSPVQMNRQLGVSFSTSTATFLQTQVSLLNGPQGCFISGPFYFAAERVNPHEPEEQPSWDWKFSTQNHVNVTRVELEPPAIAPPMSGNTTFDTLKPLLLGASLAEYSSALRVRTSVVNIDVMLKAFSLAINNLEGRTGYSFSTKLIKLLGFNLMKYAIPGINIQSVGTGINSTFTNAWDGGCEPGMVLPFHGSGVAKMIKLAAMTEWDFIDLLSGQLTEEAIDVEFTPDKFGNSTAVVFVKCQDLDDWQNNLLEAASQLPWPMMAWGWKNYYWYLYQNDNVPVVTQDTPAISKVVGTVIPGCEKGILFVVLGTKQGGSATVSVGPADVDQNHRTVNTLEQSITNPDEIEWAGETMTRWCTWLGTMASVPATNSAIKKWEDTYGNNSDRSTALRFWADHSRLYGISSKVTNGVQSGSQQSAGLVLMVAPFRSDDDDPTGFSERTNASNDYPPFARASSWLASPGDYTVVGSRLSTSDLGWLGCMKTASGLQPYPTAKGNNSNDPYTPVTNAEPIATILPTRDPVIELLASKKWIYPMEEYPESTLRDPARVAYTVVTMNNIIAATYDLMLQASDVTSPLFYIPGAAGLQQAIRSRTERVIMKGMRELFSQGIQFPSSYNRYNDMVSTLFSLDPDANPTTSPASFVTVTFGPDFSGATTKSSVARIPREISASWSPILLPIANKLRLNFDFSNPSKSPMFIGDDRFDMLTVFVNDDDCHLNSVERIVYNRYLSRISQGVVGTGVSSNPGAFVINKLNNVPMAIVFSVRSYDESRNLMVNQSVGRGGLTQPVTSTIFPPKVENINTRDNVNSYSPLSLVMAGPLDAFGPGDGSFSYNMYYTNSGSYATITTTNFTVVPENVYSGSAITSMMSNF